MPVYVDYCRKSSEPDDRQVLSNPSQLKELQRLEKKVGLSVSRVFTESKSAKAPGRPLFNEMMAGVYRGEIHGILCWKLDRLARNPIDGGTIIWALKEYGLQIITPTRTYTQADSVFVYLEVAMAQKYVDDLSENVKRGLQEKNDKGRFPGFARQGYINNQNKPQGERDIGKDPDRFHLVRQMWDLMLTGLYSPKQIVKIANGEWHYRTRQIKKRGGRPLHISMLYRIFTDPFYYGSYEYPKGSGSWYEGGHAPMITEEEYDRVQMLLGRKGKPRPIKKSFPFTGLMHCGECKAAVTAEEKAHLVCSACHYKFSYRNKKHCPRCELLIEEMKNPIFRHYTYYHCTKTKNPQCKQRSLETKDLEKQIGTYLSQIEISERFKDWAITYLRELYEHEIALEDARLESQRRAYKGCLTSLDNLMKLKISPRNADGSLLSDEEYELQRVKLLKVKTELEKHLEDPEDQALAALNAAEESFELAHCARARFNEGDQKAKRQILAAVGSNLALKDKKLLIEAREPFIILEKSAISAPAENGPFEPRDLPLNKGRKEVPSSSVLLGCGQREDVRTCPAGWKSLVKAVYDVFRETSADPSTFVELLNAGWKTTIRSDRHWRFSSYFKSKEASPNEDITQF